MTTEKPIIPEKNKNTDIGAYDKKESIHMYIHTYANSITDNPKILKSYKIRERLADSFSLYCKFLNQNASEGISQAMMEYMVAHAEELPLKLSFNLIELPKKSIPFIGVEVNALRQKLSPILERLQKPDLKPHIQAELIEELRPLLPKAVRLARKTNDSEFNLLLVEAQILLSDENEFNPSIVEVKTLLAQQKECENNLATVKEDFVLRMVPEAFIKIYGLPYEVSQLQTKESREKLWWKFEELEQAYENFEHYCLYNDEGFKFDDQWVVDSENPTEVWEQWKPEIDRIRGLLEEYTKRIEEKQSQVARLKRMLAGCGE